MSTLDFLEIALLILLGAVFPKLAALGPELLTLYL